MVVLRAIELINSRIVGGFDVHFDENAIKIKRHFIKKEII